MKDLSESEQNIQIENQFISKVPEEKLSENLEETFKAPEALVTADLFPEDFFPSAQDQNKSLDEAEIKIGNLQHQLDDGNGLKLFEIPKFSSALESLFS